MRCRTSRRPLSTVAVAWVRGAGLASLALVAFLAGCAPEDDAVSASWPQFRGPGGSGVSPELGLPIQWDPTGADFRWRIDFPYAGVSSPIVTGSRVVLTGEERDGDEVDLQVIAVDLKTGELEWRTTVISRTRESFPQRSVLNTPAGPTPVTDGEVVFADFGTHLAAVDLDGTLVWKKEIEPDYLELLYYGAGSSLVIAGDNVIVFRDRERIEDDIKGWIAAFDKKTGERRWRSDWDDTCCSFTTPLVSERGGKTQIIVLLAARVVGYDATTGEELWRRSHEATQPVSSPAIEGEILCIASGAHGNKQSACWRLDPTDGRPEEDALWLKKPAPSTGSPLMYNGLFFTLHEKGFLRCQDPLNGAIVWQMRLDKPQYHASLVAGDGKLYAVSSRGSVAVVAADRSGSLLAETALPDGDIVTTPALADGCLILRTASSLLCIDGPEEG